MNRIDSNHRESKATALACAKKQRSHILFVFSNALDKQAEEFLQWYIGDFVDISRKLNHVLSIQYFERHEVDITEGNFPTPDYDYLGIYELSLDGSDEAKNIIAEIIESHDSEGSAGTPACWLYHPVSEKIGRLPQISCPMLTVAFTSSVKGSDKEFREWYCTRHIRHALNVPVLVSGQCFELAGFQSPGSSEPIYSIVAIYEQEGTPEEFLDNLKSLPQEMFEFPSSLDASRFAEGTYRPISNKLLGNGQQL